MYGELLPLGGGDPIPLLKPSLKIGRRESADIVLRFPNVSGIHCELTLTDGYWTVTDLRSSNGTKVNGTRVTEQRLQPGDKLGIAKHMFEIAYEPARLGATEVIEEKSVADNIFGRSLLSSAGLEHRETDAAASPPPRSRRQSI
ncbi:MAG: FHA domain-containing protein [Planctomycetia bacterium]|nr:FHA domain-containing protein [Planctomycetia bacterium]